VAGVLVSIYVSSFIESKNKLEDESESNAEGYNPVPALFWPVILVIWTIALPFCFIDWMAERHAKSLYESSDKPSKHGDRVEFPDEPIQ